MDDMIEAPLIKRGEMCLITTFHRGRQGLVVSVKAHPALEEIIRVTNEFLVATAAREPKIAAKADVDGVVVKEEKKDRLVLDAPELYREVRNVRI